MINTPLMHKTLETIKLVPAEHHQPSWRCNTGMCFAGHAATIDGCEWVVPLGTKMEDLTKEDQFMYERVYATQEDIEWIKSLPQREQQYVCIEEYKGRETIPVRWYAQRVLGLSMDQADALFAGSNSQTMIEHIVCDYTQGARD